jgi:nucleolar protein 12
MSLLGSIFGKAKKENDDRSSLFQKSDALPERPQHKPVERKRKEKKEETPRSDQPATDEFQNNKKRRKDRKVNNSSTEQEEVANTGAKRTNNEKKEESKDAQDDKSGDEQAKIDAKVDDEERTVFVGNLPLASTTRKSMAKLFQDCGPIESTRIRSVPVTGVKLPAEQAGNQNLMRKVSANTGQVDESLKTTVQGYVVFKSVESVEKALQKNNVLKVDGFRIRVDRAAPTVEPSRSVFCGNLPYGTDEVTLQEHFVKGCDFDAQDVQGARIIRDKTTYQCKGFGYVLLKDKSLVPAALKLHNSTYMKKQIRVTVCGKRFKGRKGEPVKNTPNNKASIPGANTEKASIGAFRRVLGKEALLASSNKRKRGEKKKSANGIPHKAGVAGISKRAAADKKTDKREKKIQKRISKGMGKTKT